MKVIARQLRLVTLITVGWCLQAQAQPTDFSLPPLPGSFPTANGSTGASVPIPSTPFAPNAGAKKDSGAVSETADAPAATPDAFPELANLPIPGAPAAIGATAEPATTATPAGATTATTTPAAQTPAADTAAAPAVPVLPPVLAEGTDTVAGEQATTAPTLPAAPVMTVAAPLTTLPGLGLPPAPTMVASGTEPSAMPTMETATTLQEISVDAPPKLKMGGRTWNTKLAPAVVPKNTSFNYRRQVLPDAIYRAQYDRENDHLPTRVTRDDYARYLAERVAANDINGTRALLNEGLSVNTTDGYGQSLLSIARRSGARDTERLLIARGAS